MAKAKDSEVAKEQKATDEQLDKERDVSASKQRDNTADSDASGSASDSGSDVAAESQSEMSADDFREQQKADAANQGLTSDRAVPEVREGRAFEEGTAVESDVTKRQREAGLIDPEPMDKAAYDRANSESEQKKAAKEGRQEALKVADYIEVVNEDSPYFGQKGSIVRCEYTNEDYGLRGGQPEQRFIQPLRFEARSIGGPVGDQTMMLEPDDVKKISEREWIGAA